MNRSTMNRRLLAGTASLAAAPFVGIAAGATANAADMPLKAPPPHVSTLSWAGWYLGLSAGGAWESNYWASADGAGAGADG